MTWNFRIQAPLIQSPKIENHGMESTVENDTAYFKNKMKQRFVCVYLFIKFIYQLGLLLNSEHFRPL